MIGIAAVLAFIALSSVSAHAIAGDAVLADAAIARHAVMFLSSRGACTGAPLGQDMVLTAAHCVVDGFNFKIRGHSVEWPPPPSDVAEIARHPRFDPDRPPATRAATPDLALLKLSKPLPPRYAPVILAARPVAIGDRLIIVGYGAAVHGDGKTAGTARMAMLIVVGLSDTRLSLTDPTAYREGGKLTACSGDSGAPAFALRGGALALAAIVSGGSAGCSGVTTVTPLTPHRDWLVETARKLGSPLAP